MPKARALLVTQYYPPELVGSAPFCGDLAEWLAQGGWKTTVLTGLPHYPGAEVFPSYRHGARRRERINGVDIERLGTWVPRRRSALARLASELWFFINGCRALASRRVLRHGLVFSLCPSVLAVLLGTIACHRRGRHVALVHDIQSGLAHGLNMVRSRRLLRLMQLYEGKILNRVDLILVLTEEMREHLRRIGVTAAIEIVPIWADADRIAPVADMPGKSVRVVYSGSFGRKQNLDQIAALAEELQRRSADIEVLLRGGGAEFDALRAKIAATAPRNVRFADLCPAEDLFAGMSGADIHLVVQSPAAAAFAIPSKIYNIMAAGLPCIAPADAESALGRLQRESQGFLRVPPDDPSALLKAVLRLAEDPALRRELGRNGRRYIEANCGKARILPRLVDTACRAGERKAPSRGRDVLVFEPIADGHPQEWLCHIARCARLASAEAMLWLVVAPELYASLAAELRGGAGERIRLLPLTRHEAKACRHRWPAISSFARWWIARRYLARTGAVSAHFLELDLLSLPLALGMRLGGRRISGILFRPSSHYRFLGSYDPTWRERLRDLRKEALYRRMLANRSLAAVLTIDPYFAPYARRFYANGAKIHALRDPAHPRIVISAAECRLAGMIPPRRLCFLMFGHLTERKGTLKLLDALYLLPEEIAARAAVMLVGTVDPTIREALARKSSALQAGRTSLFFCLDDRRVGAGELEALMRRADVVLAPYQRFVGSSGVMMWAARCATPILTQDFGVLGRLARDHGLGMTVDCKSPAALARGIARFVTEGPSSLIDRRSAAAFAASHSPEEFAEAVLASAASP
jgi:colanic acid biosynthesis glycosyl transferase WcaI